MVRICAFLYLLDMATLHRLSKKGIAGIIVMLAIACQVIPGDFNDSIFLYPRILSYSVFFLAGYVMRDVNRDILRCNRNFAIVSVLFVVFCCLLVETIKVPYGWNYFLAFIGCWFVWALSFQLLKVKPASRFLGFCGKYSLSFYWLNGFALVPARMLIVKILHVENTPLIAISIFLICVVSEVIAIKIIKRIPVVKTMVGM